MAGAFEAGCAMTARLSSAAVAFDAVAPEFDARFGKWTSVAAQRRAVRSALLSAFPRAGRILELGGGTGEDALFLASNGFEVLLTDSSPAMVSIAKTKLSHLGSSAEVVAAEEMENLAERKLRDDAALFDGAFSNFAPLNCVVHLRPTARGLARLLKPEAPLLLVVFGTFCPAEIVTEILRGRPHNALRRMKHGQRPARISGHDFHVVYHCRRELIETFTPWFVLERRIGIGVTVPPSAAEPWITKHPRLLAAMEAIDRVISSPFAALGDHVLYQFRRTSASVSPYRI
jgi:ubiquinone/menaquinone biosynthesis C-methylase UbiE